MGKLILATAVAMALVAGQVQAASTGTASKAEVQALQAQMQALAERLNRLEAANAQLSAQNAELQALADRREAETDYLKAQTKELREESAVATNEISKVKGADWAARIKGRGDLRYRHERLTSERDVNGTVADAANRDRDRIRARLGFDATLTDNVRATLQLATGGDDPRGTNQTLGGTSSRKQIGLDLAYADWRFMHGSDLVLGKQPYPIWRPLQSLFLDPDVNPEGGAARFARGPAFANLYGFWVSEQYNADPDGENSDANIFGLQAGVKFAALGGETLLAANYYVCGACKDNSPLYNNNANGNTTYRVGTVNMLQYGYDILDLSAQVGTTVFELPLTLTGGFARNLAADVEYDTAWALGAYLGHAATAGSWEAGAMYQSVDKDALFGQIADSDFGDGRTDAEGWVFKGGYAPVQNLSLYASYFLNTTNKDVGTELDVTRLQLDVNYKF
jgi:cell division protein FtsB